jgi:hypothetical protein
MSYLKFPRLHFAGEYQADPSTINNAERYDNNTFQPRFQRAPFGGWNPAGTGAFRFRDCRVTGVVFPDGRIETDPRSDPLVGGALLDDDKRVSAKLVDLDTQQQLVSQIWGLRLILADTSGKPVFRGNFAPTAFADIWLRSTPSTERPDIGAAYQSVLTDVEWSDGESPFTTELRHASEEGLLSIKFTLDGFTFDANSARFTTGRIVGSIGAYTAEEPKSFVAGRRLHPEPGSTLNHAPCLLDEETGRLFLDLGNSVPTVSPGGELADVGALQVAVLPANGHPVPLAPLGTVDNNFYPRRAGIVCVQLNRGQVALAAENPLAVVDSGQAPKVLLAENAEGAYLRADNFVFRLYPTEPYETATAVLTATRFGRPAAGEEVSVTDPSGTAPVKFPASVTTDEHGRAEVTLTAVDPGLPRDPHDGRFCSLEYTWQAEPADQAAFPTPHRSLNIVVQDTYTAPERPTWIRDVQPIFQQYANLYPVMREVFDLANYHHVVAYRHRIRKALLAPPAAPGHMPVTRDLSPAKRDMIVAWLDIQPEPPMLELRTAEDLRSALQQAIELEHATIPAYLCALFSLRNDRNTKVGTIIRGVVQQEMLHMALAANLLNAIGGEPVIGRPGFVPVYPGHLPGGVLPELMVTLRKCSIEQIRDVFMEIERPEHPTVGGVPFTGAVIDREAVTLDGAGNLLDDDEHALSTLAQWFIDAEYNPFTIGWFYNQIAMAVIRLDDELRAGGGSLFTGDPARQVSWPGAPGTLYQVIDRRSALLAIYEIIEQGEGSPHDTESAMELKDSTEFGHYYRFKEIVEGRELIRGAHGKWAYDGAPIPFDPGGVYPMTDDPDTTSLPEDSPARLAAQVCDEAYADLLRALNEVFNGQPEKLDDAVGLMFSVQVQAKKLLASTSLPGSPTVVGPSFQV